MNYCIRQYFAYIYFRGFGLSAEIREGLISRFSDVFIHINRHTLKWKFLRGLTREIRENKTTAKITTYTVCSYKMKTTIASCTYSCIVTSHQVNCRNSWSLKVIVLICKLIIASALSVFMLISCRDPPRRYFWPRTHQSMLCSKIRNTLRGHPTSHFCRFSIHMCWLGLTRFDSQPSGFAFPLQQGFLLVSLTDDVLNLSRPIQVPSVFHVWEWYVCHSRWPFTHIFFPNLNGFHPHKAKKGEKVSPFFSFTCHSSESLQGSVLQPNLLISSMAVLVNDSHAEWQSQSFVLSFQDKGQRSLRASGQR